MFIIKALYLKDIALFWWKWRDFFVIPIVCRRHPINILQSLLTQASLDSQTLQNLVETIIKFSNSFIQDLLQVYEFAEKNSSCL